MKVARNGKNFLFPVYLQLLDLEGAVLAGQEQANPEGLASGGEVGQYIFHIGAAGGVADGKVLRSVGLEERFHYLTCLDT